MKKLFLREIRCSSEVLRADTIGLPGLADGNRLWTVF